MAYIVGKLKPNISTMKNEIWKPVKGYESMYEVSNYGRCRSLDRQVNSKHGTRTVYGQILRPDLSNNGYLRYSFSRSQNRCKISAHRLVAKHFIPNPENKPQVNHIDSDKTNNHVDNLEWVTMSENMKHDYKHNSRTSPYVKGEKHFNAKLTKKDVVKIKQLLNDSELNQSDIADKFNVCPSHISDIKREKRWAHIEV